MPDCQWAVEYFTILFILPSKFELHFEINLVSFILQHSTTVAARAMFGLDGQRYIN